MDGYYLDASAAVKGYVAERGSDRILPLLESTLEHEVYLSRIGVVEIAAAIFGKVRAGEVRFEEAVSATVRLREDVQDVFEVVEVDPTTSERAIGLAERRWLRAYDCLQLATALLLQEQRGALGLASLIFVSSDGELNAAARAEGLTVEDPAV